jgi:hypothetical protein
MLLVQKYLENHTLGDLARDHGVYASFSKSGHKFSLNYDQLEAKESDPLAQECRGLILAREDGASIAGVVGPDGKTDRSGVTPGATTILAYPMKRFFNYGQGSAANIDWGHPDLAVLEKLDGTLCIVYFDPFIDQWCMATRSVPEADLLMDNGLFTFRTLFEKALLETTKLSFEQFTNMLLMEEYTYCFELTTPYNRIVVNYPNCGVTLLAIRHVYVDADGLHADEQDPAKSYLAQNVPVVQAYTLPTVEKVIEWVSSLNPMEHEGVVVRQGENRIKVKNPAYVAYNRVRETLGASPRNVMSLILSEKDDDVVPFLPEEIVKNLQVLKAGVQVVIKQHDDNYLAAVAEAAKTAPGDKKTFAVLVTKDKRLWSSPFFSMFDGKSANMRDFIQKNRQKDGDWSNGFLDKMLELAKHVQP